MKKNQFTPEHTHADSIHASQTDSLSFSLDEFVPEIFDCEADGSCSSGHIHQSIKPT